MSAYSEQLGKRSTIGREESGLPRDVDANVGGGLEFIEHPPLVLR